jgi:hypothetical protein
MQTLVAMGVVALLFIVFGLVRPRTECTGHGCAACGAACHRHQPSGDDHDVA